MLLIGRQIIFLLLLSMMMMIDTFVVRKESFETHALDNLTRLDERLLVLVDDEDLSGTPERARSMRGLEHEMRLPEEIKSQETERERNAEPSESRAKRGARVSTYLERIVRVGIQNTSAIVVNIIGSRGMSAGVINSRRLPF